MVEFDLKHPVPDEDIEIHHKLLAAHSLWDSLMVEALSGEISPAEAVLAMVIHVADQLTQEMADETGIDARRALDAIVGLAFAARGEVVLGLDLVAAIQAEAAGGPEEVLAEAWDDAVGHLPALPPAGTEGDQGQAVSINLDAEERRYLSDLLNAAPIHLEEQLYGRSMNPLWERLAKPLAYAETGARRNPFKAITVRPGAV